MTAMRTLGFWLGQAAVAVAQGTTSLWTAIAPGNFFHSYPSASAPWLTALGPYNEHLTFDFGVASLGLALLMLAAAVKPTAERVRLACSCFCAWSVPHLIYHVTHIEHLPEPKRWKNAFALTLSVAIPLILLVASWFFPPRERMSR